MTTVRTGVVYITGEDDVYHDGALFLARCVDRHKARGVKDPNCGGLSQVAGRCL